MLSLRRIVAASALVCLSLIVPAGVVCRSIHSAVSEKKHLGYPVSLEQKLILHGSVKNGELWFPVERYSNSQTPQIIDCRIMRVDLATGMERETGLMTSGDGCYPQWIKDELYLLTRTAIYRAVGASLQKVAPSPPNAFNSRLSPFHYDGRLTVVSEVENGRFRLCHLIDGVWVDGREILLPTPGHVWYHDTQRGRWSLLPLTSQQPAGAFLADQYLSVIQHGQRFHLFLSNLYTFYAYRSGFEFADEDRGDVSALAPENSVHEVSGWEPVDRAAMTDQSWRMGCDRHGTVWTSSFPYRVVRRNSDGTCEPLIGFDRTRCSGLLEILADPADSTAYILDGEPSFNSARVYRVEGNVIYPAHLRMRGCVPEYLRRWQRLLDGLLCAWLLHLAIVLGGTMWFTRSDGAVTYQFGNRRVSLASTGRRALAFTFDVLLPIIALCLLLFLQMRSFGVVWSPYTETELCESLYGIERDIRGELQSGTLLGGNTWVLGSLWRRLPEGNSPYIVMGISEALALFIAKIGIEWYFGFTPGKWMFRLRTVTLSLRPVGFSKVLIRNVFDVIDVPSLLTPIPAALSMILSPHRQRLSDRVADTVVIHAFRQETTPPAVPILATDLREEAASA